jgi:hypothetical protein
VLLNCEYWCSVGVVLGMVLVLSIWCSVNCVEL